MYSVQLHVHGYIQYCTTYHVSNIVYYNSCLGSSVVHRCQTVVSLLTGCVPDLKLDCRIVKINCLSEKGSCMCVCTCAYVRELIYMYII